MPRKIRVSHSTGSERILTSDDESSTDTGIQNQSPSEGSADYSDSATEEEWTSVDYDDIGPSDSVSGPRAPSNRGPRQHPTSHGQRSSQVRRPRSVSYHRPIHRSVPVEVSPPRTTSYRGRDRIPPGPAEEEEEDIGPRYQTHRRPHRRPTSVNSDSLDPHDDYPGLARGAPHPHPHGQWADVPQHAAPPGYAGSMMSGAGPYQHQHYQAAGGMPGSANQLVRFAPHLDPYGYGAAGPNVYSPTPSNPFSPAASSSIGSSGYFEHGHHRAAAYPRAAPYPAGGNYYNNHPAGNPYPMYYYPQGDPHAESPPPGMKSYGRPASTPAVEDERLAKLEKLVIEQRDKEKAEAPKKEEDDKFTKLEKLILLQKEEQIAREKAAEARAKADKATVDAKLAKEVADKRAAEDTAKALTDAAAKARKDAEEKAADEAKKAKEEHEKKVKELTEAAEAAQKAADAAKAPGEKKLPIKFKDALGRKFSFPWEVCRTWKGMEELIKQAFVHVDVIGPHVQEGHYDLVGPNNEIILPQVWETVVQPDWMITMHMWPMPEPVLDSKKAGGDHNIVIVDPLPSSRKKGSSSNSKKMSRSSSHTVIVPPPPPPPPPPITAVPASSQMSIPLSSFSSSNFMSHPPPPPPPPMGLPTMASYGTPTLSPLGNDIPIIVPPPPPAAPMSYGGRASSMSPPLAMVGIVEPKKKKEQIPSLLAWTAGRGRAQGAKKGKR